MYSPEPIEYSIWHCIYWQQEPSWCTSLQAGSALERNTRVPFHTYSTLDIPEWNEGKNWLSLSKLMDHLESGSQFQRELTLVMCRLLGDGTHWLDGNTKICLATQLRLIRPHRAWQVKQTQECSQLQYGKSLELHEMWGIHFYANLERTCWNLNSVVFTKRCSVDTWIINTCT